MPSSNNQRHRMNSFFPSTQTCLARTPGTICSRGAMLSCARAARHAATDLTKDCKDAGSLR
ncbi:hypothetical protein K474DRAFT_1660560 [Panus rudis PR-1116 ss-1]|nr:hypothetical protein K474DRAFT_1667183 [Panus rudis PR-1116 ss-1]KAI0073824.1 hypothetical protein K474DRAFT_1666180 [Panus rudis PR-1116 ss-1]KAI0075830.1 hypothetical protein K474DRAFT_1663836 [Panus rudis PR-1116 ss-1]KAI0078336.1 hypothetical protein K474DRAFT_1660560 [Panus rudis PR-1116 ss-1]